MEITKTFTPKSKKDWRNWLSKNHDKEKEIWAVIYKKATGRQIVSHQDAVDEALCFGWIDSIEKSLDEQRFVQRFTPRKKRSNWSEINTKRYKELLKEGYVVLSGKEAFRG